MSPTRSVNEIVQAFDKERQAWVTGMVTHIFPNGTIEVCGINNWEGVIVKCKPEEALSQVQ